MKETEKDKPTPTIPRGVWESTHTDKRKRKTEKQHVNEISTDAQGNGYPISKSEQSVAEVE